MIQELKHEYNTIKTWSIGNKIRLGFGIGVVLSLIITIWIVFPIQYALSSEGKGLIVHVTISTNLVSQPVYLDTYQHGQFVVGHDSYMDNGVTEIVNEYEKGEIDNGEFEICATAQEGMQQCAYGYNGEEKEPEYVSIEMYSNNTPQPVQPQQPQNNNENNNANSQSQEQKTQIYICNDGKCAVQ